MGCGSSMQVHPATEGGAETNAMQAMAQQIALCPAPFGNPLRTGEYGTNCSWIGGSRRYAAQCQFCGCLRAFKAAYGRTCCTHIAVHSATASDNDEDPVITQAEALDHLVSRLSQKRPQKRDFGIVTVHAHVRAFQVVSLTRCSVLSRCYE
jgi:hypothetical protein